MAITITRYGLSLKLDCDNAAFEDNRAAEVARILRRLADRLDGQTDPDHIRLINDSQRIDGFLWDRNGNGCGTWEAKTRRIRV